MNLHDEIVKVAFELYEKSGRIDGRNMENWVEAERIVKARHASDDLTTKMKQIEEKAEDFMHAAKEGVRVTIQVLSNLTKKVLNKGNFN
jgi:hypothetical protein